MVHREPLKEAVGSRSTFPNRAPNSSANSETVQKILQKWIEAAAGRLFHSSFIDSLRDGVHLCRLINRIEPNRIQNVVENPTKEQALQNMKLIKLKHQITVLSGYSKMEMITDQENLQHFIDACSKLGLYNWQLFDPKELQETDVSIKRLTSKDGITQKVINTLYWLGCTSSTMSHYNGPHLDVSKLHRRPDGIISIKQNGSTPQSSSRSYSAMYGGETDDDIDDTYQVNGSLVNGMNGYEESGFQSLSQPYEFSINVRIMGDEKRFGFSVMGGVDEGFPPRIDNIVKGSPAERAALCIGDELLEVNGVPLLNLTHMEVISAIHKCLKNRVIALKLLRGGEGSMQGGFSTFLDNSPTVNGKDKVDPTTQHKIHSIIRDQENDPQFQYYNSDAETNSVHSYEQDQLDDSPNLRNSHHYEDMIVSPNNGGFFNADALQSNLTKNKSLSTAVLDLRKLDVIDGEDQQVMSLQNDAYDSDSNASSNTPVPYEPQPVSPASVHSLSSFLPKKPEPKATGFSEVKPKLSSRSDKEKVVYIEEYLANKEVSNAKKIYDKVLELKQEKRGPGYSRPESTNSHNIVGQISTSISNSHGTRDEEELECLLNSPNIQGLLLAHDRLAFREALPDDNDDDEEEEREELERQHSMDDQMSQIEDDTVKIVSIDKSNDPLGATVKNEDGAVVIGRIVKGGAAEKSGLLHEGDEIIEINGVSMKGRSVAQVCELLEDMNGTLTFLVIPNNRTIGTLTRQGAVHVRAHFDYDPDGDELIPCRELGLAFRKGAVLHIVNQDDPNWWQAWRAGEEGKRLAGLIPSKTFQQQRESLKHSLPTESESTTKSKRRCLCVKRKKRKKVLYNAMHSDGLEVDQALTYEEVALLDPISSRKRPVILIGPTKIGRTELRQRLLDYNPERFAGAIPHTSQPLSDGQVNGRDYHFVTRRIFESEIATNKYVEHGEYHGHYYGMSLDSIRAVVNSGRITILNLNCGALKRLKSSDVMPYVVFISPPSFERIKALRRGKVDPFNPKLPRLLTDAELHAMIDEGREMEEAFGHYFDDTITNSNLERTFSELLHQIDRIESEPQWVPTSWIR